ncbi:type 1 glutamine amidotransferase [Zavarzinia sp. CC-PAN008]|uniref:type 1 glutamine amidotransferase n=1 Tax=Zavarzinia sp. CC-PAN008 TaxID=3243332 RepID=UPI003F742EEA
MRILVVENDAISGPALIGDALVAGGATLDARRPHQGQALPVDLSAYDAMLVLGGPQHANDDDGYPAFQGIITLMRQALAADRPVLGICLGAQLLARAHGGRVYRMGWLEVGLPPLGLTPAAETDAVLHGLGPRVRAMQWHEDHFDLPPETVRLLEGERCPNQAFRLGRASYGFQCHPEAGRVLAGQWLDQFSTGPFQKHFGAGASQALARARAEVATHAAASEPFARTLAMRWLHLGA